MAKKLQNSFNAFLPQKYLNFRRSIYQLSANEAVVAELIRVCCEENNVKAIKLAFERILGKPERAVIIKQTLVRTVFPDATGKELKPPKKRPGDVAAVVDPLEGKVVITEENAPGILLKRRLDEIGEKPRDYAYQVVDDKDQYEVAEVMAANLYSIAMRGGNLAAISMLFDYLDGAVADVVRLEGQNTVLLENYADVAPYEAIQGEDGIFYVESEAVG